LNNLDDSGLGYGLQIGYNYRMDNWVFGVEGDFSALNAGDSVSSIEFPGAGPDSVKTDIQGIASLRGRIGYAMDEWMFFGTAGYGYTQFNLKSADVFSGTQDNQKFADGGWVAGLGVEYAMTNYLGVRLEYLHYNFGKKQSLFPSSNTDIDPGDNVKINDVDSVRLGLNYQF